ncbi:hypothetical protein H8959_004551, partial [Pygathrix nigripes]
RPSPCTWTVYLLARHPEVQQMVYREIVKNLGERHVPTAADVPKVPLVRALLKETLRLFPVLPGNGRVTQEDLVIGGYLIPKGTQLALCHYATSYQDENFPRAKEFRPERWLRKGDLDRVDNFGSIPFGHGVRSCIGRRIAELEIHLVVIQLLQHFEIKTSSQTKAVHAKTHGLLTPGGPIHVRFVNRKCLLNTYCVLSASGAHVSSTSPAASHAAEDPGLVGVPGQILNFKTTALQYSVRNEIAKLCSIHLPIHSVYRMQEGHWLPSSMDPWALSALGGDWPHVLYPTAIEMPSSSFAGLLSREVSDFKPCTLPLVCTCPCSERLSPPVELVSARKSYEEFT